MTISGQRRNEDSLCKYLGPSSHVGRLPRAHFLVGINIYVERLQRNKHLVLCKLFRLFVGIAAFLILKRYLLE